jgi:hypothetical protein
MILINWWQIEGNLHHGVKTSHFSHAVFVCGRRDERQYVQVIGVCGAVNVVAFDLVIDQERRNVVANLNGLGGELLSLVLVTGTLVLTSALFESRGGLGNELQPVGCGAYCQYHHENDGKAGRPSVAVYAPQEAGRGCDRSSRSARPRSGKIAATAGFRRSTGVEIWHLLPLTRIRYKALM